VEQLALHRIHSTELLDASIHRPASFEIEAYMRAAGGFSYPTGSGPIELELALDPHVIIPLIEHLTEDSDGRMHLTATVPEIDELAWWLLGFGFR